MKSEKCLTEACGRDAGKRGVCAACYQAAYREVVAGRATWQELEERGIVFPRQWVRATSPITVAIRSKKARPQ